MGTSPNNVVVASFSTIAIVPYYPQLVPNILRPYGPYDPQSVPTILRPFGPYDPQSVPTILRPFDSTIRNWSLHFVFFSFFSAPWVYFTMLGCVRSGSLAYKPHHGYTSL